MECIKLNCSCKHIKKGQKQQSSHSCTELSKTQFFLASTVNSQSEPSKW